MRKLKPNRRRCSKSENAVWNRIERAGFVQFEVAVQIALRRWTFFRHHSTSRDDIVENAEQISGRDRLAWSRFCNRKSTRLNSSHLGISYAVFCLKKKKKK